MEKCSFFNDEYYLAEDWARYLKTFFTNGIFNNSLMVKAMEEPNMQIYIEPGSAHINGYRYDNFDNKILTIENADGVLSRIDNIVLRLNLTERTISAEVIKGVSSAEPVAPDLVRDTIIYDLKIAEISVNASVVEITQADIRDTRFITSDCGNVICAVATPDTEELYLQMEARCLQLMKQTKLKCDQLMKQSNLSFINWFESLQYILDGDVACNLANQIISNKSKSFSEILLKEDWSLNETTNCYEYDVLNNNITKDMYITIDTDLETKQKLAGIFFDVNSYDGGFKIESSEAIEDDIEISYVATLTTKDEEVLEDEG